MTMRYFQNPNGKVYGYDAANPNDAGSIAAALAAQWPEVTSSWPPAPSAAEQLATQVAKAFAAGITITSTSTPALNGTYAIDPAAQQRINAIETAILKNGAFPGSSGTQLAYYDAAGAPHVFPSVAEFSAFATAVANFVADLDLYAAGAPGASLPSADVTIA